MEIEEHDPQWIEKIATQYVRGVENKYLEELADELDAIMAATHDIPYRLQDHTEEKRIMNLMIVEAARLEKDTPDHEEEWILNQAGKNNLGSKWKDEGSGF